jgi:multidrug resistance efflux pump
MKLSRKAVMSIVVTGVLAVMAVKVIVRVGRKSTTVVAGTVSTRVVAPAAVVAAGGTADVQFQVDGTVTRVLVRRGDHVKAGDLLAELESQTVGQELAVAEAGLREMETRLLGVVSGGRRAESPLLIADFEITRLELDQATDRVQRSERLASSSAIPLTDLNDARRSALAAQLKFNAAGTRLGMAKGSVGHAEIATAQARLEAARAAVRLVKAKESKLRLVAPIDGVVVERRVDVGDTISAGNIIGAPSAFEIADLEHLEIRAEVDEDDADRVKVGSAVTLSTISGREIGRGKISRLDVRLEKRTLAMDESAMRGDSRIRSIWIEPDPELGPVLLNAQLEASIDLATYSVPALISRDAVRIRDGRAEVEVPFGPFTRSVAVKLGRSDESHVELIDLTPGSTILVSEGEPQSVQGEKE